MDKKIRQIAFYGKGGIGKSTIASNLAAVYAERGLNTMLIGCDPKSDCTRNLRGDADIPTVLDVLREKGVAKLGLTELVDGKQVDMDEIVYNVRGAIDDLTLVNEFAERVGTKVIGAIPNDPTIMENEIYAKTTIEYKPDSEIAGIIRDLAMAIYENKETASPRPLSREDLAELAKRIRQKTKEAYTFEGS